MTTERLHFQSGRSFLDLILGSELFGALTAFFRSLRARRDGDTSIAWEDGETEDGSDTQR